MISKSDIKLSRGRLQEPGTWNVPLVHLADEVDVQLADKILLFLFAFLYAEAIGAARCSSCM